MTNGKIRVLGCKTHRDVIEKAVEQLIDPGWFNKKDVLEELGLTLMEDSIQWKWVAEIIQEMHSLQLIGVTESWFDRERTAKEEEKRQREIQFAKDQGEEFTDIVYHPYRHITRGHGKRAAGYASHTFEQGKWGIRLLELEARQVQGCYDRYATQKGTQKEALVRIGVDTPGPQLTETHFSADDGTAKEELLGKHPKTLGEKADVEASAT